MTSDMQDTGYSLRARIYNSLKKSILDGTYKHGESLIEMKLAKELGVSRTPIREALRQLELEGLVSSIPNKGVIVEGVTLQDIDDIYTIRKTIEGLAARWAAEKISDAQLKKLKDILDLMEFYTKKGNTEKLSELDSKFHDIIFQASNSRPLESVLTNFHQFIQRARLISVKAEGRAIHSLKEHRDIYDALAAHDADTAEKAMTNHVGNARVNLIPFFEQEEL
ncbi:GntR family transcriptional regulator [Tepidanaerobacter acetatoxydans]|uniref:GntR family transcriptional regulator n=1 Tax=Tepidanaerobacter acetatoxydans TaxID=499229 RepID=UPI001BD41EE5|nr:GntR family transcriptional regulator [Tepidanaerobacter acetatoxydans]